MILVKEFNISLASFHFVNDCLTCDCTWLARALENIIYIITKIQLCPRTFIKDPHSSIPIIDFGCHLDVAVSNSQMPKCIFSISNLRQIIIISKEIFVLNWTLGEGNLFKLKFTIKISQKISIFKIRN